MQVVNGVLSVVMLLAIVVAAVCLVGLRRNLRDADHTARSARALDHLLRTDQELHELEVHRAIARASAGEAEEAELVWLTSLVRRAHENRRLAEPVFQRRLLDDEGALAEQTMRRTAATAASARILVQVRRIAAQVPTVQERWVADLAEGPAN